MPYIDRNARAEIDAGQSSPLNPGELNYALSTVVAAYLDLHGMSYGTANDIVGALEGAKAEFQRRFVGPYEDVKRVYHGDVYAKIWHPS